MDIELTRETTTPTISELSSYDIIIFPVPNLPTFADELGGEILDLVFSDGTGLLVVGDQRMPTFVNSLSENFGVAFGSGTVIADSHLWDEGSSEITIMAGGHLVNENVDTPVVNYMSPVLISAPQLDAKVVVLAFANGDAQALLGSCAGPFAYAVAIEYGKGRIVILADNNSIFDIYSVVSAENAMLLKKSIKWLSEPRLSRI